MKQDKDLKKEILDTATELFIKDGYNNVSLQTICDELGVTKGAITYHFQYKYRIAINIIDDIFQTIRLKLNEFDEVKENRYLFESTRYIIFYLFILNNPGYMDMFYLSGENHNWEKESLNTVFKIYSSINRDFHKNISDQELKIAINLDMNARRQLYIMYKNKDPLLDNHYTFCYYNVYLMGRLCHLEMQDITDNLNKAFAFVDQHDYTEFIT